MSVKKVLFTIFAGSLVGAAIWVGNSKWQRKPASFVEVPPLPIKPWAHSPFQKINQAFTVVITPISGLPASDSQELTLKATVTLHREIQGDVHFQWELPADAEHVSGHLSDSWPHLLPGQSASTEISLLNVSKEGASKMVSLHVTALSDEVKYAVSGSFITDEYKNKESQKSVGSLKVDEQLSEGLQKSKTNDKLKIHQ